MTEDAESDSGIFVRVSRDRAQVEQDVYARLLLIVALAVAALAVAVGLAIVQTRRLTLPLRDLAMIAERLGSGDARPSKHRYGIPELDRVAQVLDRSATRISDLLTREREFATDASHQLRTPLTGLTMRLEEIVAASNHPEVVREEGEAAIVQAERLTAVIDELLAAARRQRHSQAEPTSIDQVLVQQVTEWDPVFRGVGRRLVLEGTRDLKALATTGGFGQVIATLLENSLRHGGGTVTVTTTSGDNYVVTEVTDEGPGIDDEIAPKIFDRNVSGGRRHRSRADARPRAGRRRRRTAGAGTEEAGDVRRLPAPGRRHGQEPRGQRSCLSSTAGSSAGIGVVASRNTHFL
ncbi:sensor histidine kinase [Nonomuraea ferruginea]